MDRRTGIRFGESLRRQWHAHPPSNCVHSDGIIGQFGVKAPINAVTGKVKYWEPSYR